MGMEQTVGVAYGIALEGDQIKTVLKRVISELEAQHDEKLDDPEFFLDYPEEEWHLVRKHFKNVEIKSWYDENTGIKHALVFVANSYVGTESRWDTKAPTLLTLGRQDGLFAFISTFISAFETEDINSEAGWQFFATVN